jgi:FKBP-type peptidyl-prolyl cis-trans isomerase 2
MAPVTGFARGFQRPAPRNPAERGPPGLVSFTPRGGSFPSCPVSQTLHPEDIPLRLSHSFIAAAAACALFQISFAANAEEAEPVIQDGSTVSIEYTLKLDDGSVADTNVGGEPLVYTQGESQILPALETALAGLKADDTKEVSLTAEEGYGPVHEEAIQEMPLDMLPENGRQVGAQLVGQGPSGQPIFARVVEINEGNAKVDMNHPLAGKTLHFDVKVISVE